MIRLLQLSGNPGGIGQQHGEQVIDLRPQIETAMQKRLEVLHGQESGFLLALQEVNRVWEEHAPATLEMLRGIAKELDLDWDSYFTYTISSYLSSKFRQPQPKDGCTAWAAGKGINRNDMPLLVKNRDYHPDHQPLQCLARIRPVDGYPYICLTSAGSPGVFSSGMNAAGLAVADTFVASTDIGPGIARYSLMMDLLEKYSLVSDAVQYLYTRPHFGDGTVVLVDASGDIAVLEIAHSVQAVILPEDGYVASTNHFTAPETRTRCIDDEPPHLQGNSIERRKRVVNALRLNLGQIDIPWSKTLMSQCDGGLSAVCHGPLMDPNSVTISSIIFSPKELTVYVANGLPCETPYEQYQVLD